MIRMVVAEGWSVCANFLKEVCSALLLSHVHLFATPWTVAHQVHGDSPGKNARVGYHAFHQGIFPTRSPTLQVDSLPSEPPGTTKNTGVSSLFLLQGIFLTQELNHKAECWRIDAFELWCWRRLLRIPWTARRSNLIVNRKRNQSWIFFGRTDAEASILWPPDAKSWLI